MTAAWLALSLWCFAAEPIQAAESPETLLYVRTVPAGAEIRLDGTLLGHSDGLFPVSAGSHKVVLILPGYASEDKQLSVAEGRVTRLELTFKASALAPVVEGVGWGAFRVGATRDEITKAVGPPEANPDPKIQWVRWLSQHHIDCLFAPKGGALEVRFNAGFAGELSSGIKIGSPEKDVLDRYGMPDRVVRNEQAKMVEYDERGVLMWLSQGKVTDFTVFKAIQGKHPSPPQAPAPQVVPEAENLLEKPKTTKPDSHDHGNSDAANPLLRATLNQAPEAWQQGAEVAAVRYLGERNSAFQSNSSLCLEKTTSQDSPLAQAQWSQTFSYAGSQSTLTVSTQVEAEQVTKACVDTTFRDERETSVSQHEGTYLCTRREGDPPVTYDWKLYFSKVTFPLETKNIRMELQDDGAGKVWFDEIRAGYVP